jgi:hypothetical protein
VKLGTSLLNHHIPDIHPLQKLQDRVPGEPFAAKPSKDAEMDRIEIDGGYSRSSKHENVL